MPLSAFMLPGLALAAGLGLALLLAVGWMGAPGQDVVALVRYLLISGGISLGLSGAALVWLRRGSGRIWLQITLVYSLGVGLALFNIFVTAGLMFISNHDLPLLVLLLLFAAVVSLGLGGALARELARRMAALNLGARQLAAGDLRARVPQAGSDELAELAGEFNRMATLLEASVAERNRIEAARRDLVAAISHDLRTPLASLQAITEALSDGLVDDPATQARYLATMRTQIGRLSAMINDLFELAQIEAGALRLDQQPISPSDLVADTVDGLLPQARAKGIALRGEMHRSSGPICADMPKIERVLYNLASNAIRHTQPGGTVTISVETTGTNKPPAALFAVTDTGEGIDPDDLPHVFERFYRGDKSRSRATGGTGLGLAIARGIVTAHNGQIWIESTPGHGTTVRFTLPHQDLAGGDYRGRSTDLAGGDYRGR